MKIVTTTNLPLSYRLFLNDDYTSPTATNIITSDVTAADEYGTYFKTMSTDTKYFSYLYNETNLYTLVINFPKTYTDAKYQDVLESIEIVIDSKQILASDNV